MFVKYERNSVIREKINGQKHVFSPFSNERQFSSVRTRIYSRFFYHTYLGQNVDLDVLFPKIYIVCVSRLSES